jgi:hypothetical protein
MTVPACEQRRMLRALHDRWPWRRTHNRHDFHLLVRIRRPADCVRRAPAHPIVVFEPVSRRPRA